MVSRRKERESESRRKKGKHEQAHILRVRTIVDKRFACKPAMR